MRCSGGARRRSTTAARRHRIGPAARHPSVICWFGADQPFWGAQLRRAGAGVTMPTRLTADSLENALHTVDTDMVRRRALNAARAMVGADVALDAAVTAVETAVGEPGVPVRRVAR